MDDSEYNAAEGAKTREVPKKDEKHRHRDRADFAKSGTGHP